MQQNHGELLDRSLLQKGDIEISGADVLEWFTDVCGDRPKAVVKAWLGAIANRLAPTCGDGLCNVLPARHAPSVNGARSRRARDAPHWRVAGTAKLILLADKADAHASFRMAV